MELETPPQPEIRTEKSISTGPHPVLKPLSQRDLAFKDFGVMDTGHQDKKSVVGSIVLNGSLLTLVILVSMTAKKIVQANKLTTLTAPVPVRPVEPKPVPKLPKPPIVKVKPPEPMVKPPVVEVAEPPKVPQPVVKASPVVSNTPAPAKAVSPPPAPKPVPIQIARAASVANNNPNPSPVRLGNMTNPIHNTAGPAVSPINLGRAGAPGMPSGNTGLGPASKINIAGSGSPSGSNMSGHDNAPRAIRGLNNGVLGGTGTAGRAPGAVQIAANDAPPQPVHTSTQPTAPAKTPPKVLYKPRAEYTAEARQAKIEGTVYVKIHVSATGAVQVVGVSSGLGHGLDQQAIRVAQGMRFQPATQNGHPVDWDGVVNINFQFAT